jgi:hypothetical protein
MQPNPTTAPSPLHTFAGTPAKRTSLKRSGGTPGKPSHPKLRAASAARRRLWRRNGGQVLREEVGRRPGTAHLPGEAHGLAERGKQGPNKRHSIHARPAGYVVRGRRGMAPRVPAQ